MCGGNLKNCRRLKTTKILQKLDPAHQPTESSLLKPIWFLHIGWICKGHSAKLSPPNKQIKSDSLQTVRWRRLPPAPPGGGGESEPARRRAACSLICGACPGCTESPAPPPGPLQCTLSPYREHISQNRKSLFFNSLDLLTNFSYQVMFFLVIYLVYLNYLKQSHIFVINNFTIFKFDLTTQYLWACLGASRHSCMSVMK